MVFSTNTDCGLILSPTGGVFTTLEGTTYGKTATVTCHTGFDLIGPATVTCQEDGTWSYASTCRIEGNNTML